MVLVGQPIVNQTIGIVNDILFIVILLFFVVVGLGRVDLELLNPSSQCGHSLIHPLNSMIDASNFIPYLGHLL
jgi:hypothetical protein